MRTQICRVKEIPSPTTTPPDDDASSISILILKLRRAVCSTKSSACLINRWTQAGVLINRSFHQLNHCESLTFISQSTHHSQPSTTHHTMILTRALTRAALKECSRAAPRAARHAQRAAFASLPHDHTDDAPPKQKNSFGGKFNWEDPLNFKSLLTEEEVSFCG